MKELKKSKVSWPPDAMLCQVKEFGSEDCPAEVGLKQQCEAPCLPPGFEGNHYGNMWNLSVSAIPRIKWRCPPKFFGVDWWYGAGDESTERQTQCLRISKVLEAIYPHHSSIPSRSSVTLDIEGECYDDSKTPIIRSTPIEDEWKEAVESDITVSRQSSLELRSPNSSQEPAHATASGLGTDMSLAASAFLTSLMKSKDQHSMIDPDLLVKFLSDPNMVKILISDRMHKASEDSDMAPRLVDRNPQPLPHVGSMSAEPCTSVVIAPPLLKPAHADQLAPSSQPPGLNLKKPPPAPRDALPVSSGAQPASYAFPMNHNHDEVLPEPSGVVKPRQHPPFSTMGMKVVQASVGPGTGPGLKSVEYFKSLIREHGAVQETRDQHKVQTGMYNAGTDSGSVVVKGKMWKRCRYFGSRRGCRLGDNCMFLHDASKRSPKRTKFN